MTKDAFPQTLDEFLVYAPFFDKLPVPAAICDFGNENSRYFVNAAFTEVFGYTPGEIPDLGSWVTSALPDPGCHAVTQARGATEAEDDRRSGHTVPATECRVVDKWGKTRVVLIGSAHHGDFLLLTLQDITALRTTEVELDEERSKAERTAYALTEHMPGGAYTMVLRPGEDMARFSFLSTRFLTMLDLDREAVVADPMAGFACLHPDDLEQWVVWNAEAFTNRAPFSHETRVIVRGEVRWIRAESVPRALEDGSMIWEGVLVDITPLKTAETQLQSVLEAARAYTWRRDLKTRRSEFDANWATLAGHRDGERDMASEEWIQTVHPDHAEEIRQKVKAMEAGLVESDILTYLRRVRDDEWIWLQVHAGISERDESGMPTAMSGVSFDITEEMSRRLRAQEHQAELREELQRAHQRDVVAQVAGGIAHDLNNLLGVMLWSIETLDRRAANDPELGKSLVSLRQTVDMARDLVSGLGGLVNLKAPRSEHDLGKLLRVAYELIGQSRAERHQVRVLEPDVALQIRGNRTEILQVIVNLALNACDAGTPEQPAQVEIRAMPPGTVPPERHSDAGTAIPPGMEVAMFQITDTGMGISDDVRARMFQRNFTTKGSKGSGLGLPIIARILQENKAALWVETCLGSGTTMTVAWPMQLETEDSPSISLPRQDPDSPSRIEPSLLKGLQALVVDDLPDVALVLASMLETAGAEVFCETDPDFLKEVLAEAPGYWSVLVTDLHMPRTDGAALARFAASLTPPIPVVLVTARPDTLDDRSLKDFAAVLSKPVSGPQLVHAVRRAVDAKTLQSISPES